MRQQDDVSALLTADDIAFVAHLLQHIAVAHGGDSCFHAVLLHILDKAQVAHYGNDRRILGQLTGVLQVFRKNGDDLVAVDLTPLFVYSQAAVCVAVKGHAAVQPVVHHVFCQLIKVGGAAALVDIAAVRIRADEAARRAQTRKQQPGCFTGRSVGTVDGDIQPRQVCADRLCQIIDIIRQSRVHAPDGPDGCTGAQRQLCAVVEHMVLDLFFHFVRQLIAFAAEQLDPVELHRIVRG